MNPTQQQLIDSYLRNEFSESQLSSFESMMESDPAFREEVQFEQHVKEGIGEYRKAELKSRLNAIDVSPGWVGIGQFGSSAIVKTVGGLITAGIFGTAGYLVFTSESEEPSDTQPVTELVIEDFGDVTPDQRDVPELIIPEEVEAVKDEDTRDLSVDKEEITEKEVVVKNMAAKPEGSPAPDGEVKELEEEFIPQVNVPDLNEVASEEAFSAGDVEMPEASAEDVFNSLLTPLDVRTIYKRSDDIKYKFFEGKLYLYGDFKKQPYEILEINGTDARQIFVYYDADYYEVKTTDKVVELPEVADEKMIRELEILRNSKVSE